MGSGCSRRCCRKGCCRRLLCCCCRRRGDDEFEISEELRHGSRDGQGPNCRSPHAKRAKFELNKREEAEREFELEGKKDDNDDDDVDANKGRVPLKSPKGPSDEIEVSDDPCKVHVSMRIEALRKACRTFVVIYSKLREETVWCDLGHTELSGVTQFPNFAYDVQVPYRIYTEQLLRFEVYKAKHEGDLNALSDQQFLGCVEINIMEAVMARATGDGFCKKPLKAPQAKHGAVAQCPGKLAIWAEEDASSKSILLFDIRAEKLGRTDFWKPRADAFIVGHRASPLKDVENGPDLDAYRGAVELNQVLRTEVVRRTKNPKWKRVKISVQALCDCKGRQKIVLEAWDWFRMSSPRLIGTGLVNYDEMYKNFVDSKPVAIEICRRKKNIKYEDDPFELNELEPYDSKKDRSRFVIDQVEVLRSYSLMDFIRSGTEIVPIFAVDFTRSTGLRDAAVNFGNSSHPPPGEAANDYAATIEALGSVLQCLNVNGEFPCYGFGAKVPPTMSVCSHAFALNGDFFFPQVHSVESVLEMYNACLGVTRLHGPTYLNPVVNIAAKWARPYAEVDKDPRCDMKYMVLLLITDGGCQDQQQVVNTLVECTLLPISVVIVHIGDEEDPFLRDIKLEVKANQELRGLTERDFIHVARFNDFRGDQTGLAHATLYDIPDDVSNYFKMLDVEPRDLPKFEDDRGNPWPRPKVESLQRQQSEAQAEEDAAAEGHLDVLDALHAAEQNLEAQIAKLPIFLQKERHTLLENAVILGYPKATAWRVMKDGMADDSLEVLSDNILHTGYGKCPSFKDLLQEEVKKLKQAASRRSTKDTKMASKENPQRNSVMLEDGTWVSELPGSKELPERGSKSLNGSKELPPGSKSLNGSKSMNGSKELASSGGGSRDASKELSVYGSPAANTRTSTRSIGGSKDLRSAMSSKELRGSMSSKELSVTFDGGLEPSIPEHRVSISKESAGNPRGSFRSSGSKESNLSKDPPSSQGSDRRVSTGALARTRSNSVGQSPRVSLPGAVEYYESEPADRPDTSFADRPRTPADMGPTCRICLERKVSVEFVPCGHRICCDECADGVGQVCPHCRTPLRGRKSI